MGPQIMTNSINCQAIHLLRITEKWIWWWDWYLLEKWTELRDDLQNPHIESIWLEIFVFKTKSILFGCYYRPPESSKYFSNHLDQLILEQLETVNRLNKEVIIMGDLNINYLSNATN